MTLLHKHEHVDKKRDNGNLFFFYIILIEKVVPRPRCELHIVVKWVSNVSLTSYNLYGKFPSNPSQVQHLYLSFGICLVTFLLI